MNEFTKNERQLLTGEYSGARRDRLPTFKLLDTNVPIPVINQAKALLTTHTGNDINEDQYSMSVSNIDPALFPRGYRQVRLQKEPSDNTNTGDERNFKNWIPDTDTIQEYLNDWFGEAFRTRVTELEPKGVLPWHIDHPTNIISRLQIAVDPQGAEFMFWRRGKLERFQAKEGEMWFINAAWPHQVVNNPKSSRLAMVTGVDFKNIRHLL